MESLWTTALWQQFGAAIDTLENALVSCPLSLWNERLWSDSSAPPVPVEFSQFWNITFHTIFWLDLYLSGSLVGFAPPTPFSLEDLEDLERPYTKDELHAYLTYTRTKCHTTIATLTPEKAGQLCEFPWAPATLTGTSTMAMADGATRQPRIWPVRPWTPPWCGNGLPRH